MSVVDQMEHSRRTRAAIEDLIADPSQLGPDFAPIVAAADGSVVGYKATGRGKPGTGVDDTLTLLAGAQSLGLVERLDWAFRCYAFDVALADRLPGELHLTPEPETFRSACPPRLAASWNRGRRELDVVAELHDDAFADEGALRAAVDEMRGWGWRFAVADMSALPVASAVLAALDWVRPAYVQVAARDTGRLSSPGVRQWLDSAAQAGAQVMAVGVTSAATSAAARAAGASFWRR